MNVLVGVDIGATKVAIRVVGPDGSVRDLEFSSAGWAPEDVGGAARWIVGHLESVTGTVAAVGVGAQGCDTQEHCDALASALASLGFAATVVNDAALLVPAAGLASGIGVIAGTGSIGVGASVSGEVLFAGGWGWVLGDEGSAPALVREATKSALLAYDGGLVDDGLLEALLTHYGMATPQALARVVNDAPTPANWGPAAVAVFSAAASGSVLAWEVVDAAAGHLALLVSQLVARGAVGETVVAAGSVIVKQRLLASRLRERLVRSHPGLDFQVLDVPPVAGGVELARRRVSG